MKIKNILYVVLAALLASSASWLFFRNDDTPLADKLKSGLPFGSGEDINIPGNITEPVEETAPFNNEVATSESKLLRLSDVPVAGFIPLTRGSSTVVRYVERATGHIFDFPLPKAGESPAEKVRVTNNTLPKIYEAYFRPDGSAVLLRSLKNDSDVIENMTLALTPPKKGSDGELYSVLATNIRGNIDSVFPGAGNTLFYFLRDISAIVSSTFNGENMRPLYSSDFSDWRIFELGNGIGIYTKASAGVPGLAYSLSGGSLSKLMGPLDALTVTGNPEGTKILYSYIDNGKTKLVVKDLKTKSELDILPASLAEKCIWSAKKADALFCGTPVNGLSDNEPDNWYIGRTHFSDYIWRFDTDSELAQLILEPKATFDIDLDVSEPKLSPDEDYLVFINKRDLTLWAVKLD